MRNSLKLMDATTDDGTFTLVDFGAQKGTCPFCGRKYTLRTDGCLWRHGTGDCFSRSTLPAELLPALFLIASLGDINDGGNTGNTPELQAQSDIPGTVSG